MTNAHTTNTSTTCTTSNAVEWELDFYQCLALILIADGKLCVTSIIMIAPPPNTKANANTNRNIDDDFVSNMLTIQSCWSNKYQPILIGSGECTFQNTYEQHCGFFTLPALPIDPTMLFYDWYNTTQSTFQQLHLYLQTFYSTYISDMLTIQKH